MSQQSDDSIEQFFRKAVVQQDKTFMERDWASMEKMLDEQALLVASQRKGSLKALMATGVVITVLTFLFVGDIDSETSENSVQMQAAVGVLGPLRGVKNERSTADLHSSIDCFENIAIASTNTKTSSVSKLLGRTQSTFNTKEETVTQPESGAKPETDAPQGISMAATPENELTADLTKVTDLFLPANVNTARKAITLTEPVKADSMTLKINEASDSEPAGDLLNEEKAAQRSAPRFSITGLLSPDFSTTSLTKYSRPSNVFGLLVGYRVMNRVTLMTGATKSLKRYEGYGQDYSPPEGYWRARTNGVIPDEVEGKCGIIEIPIIVQADVMQKKKSRLFVSAGVSSYFMRSEHYQYTFNEPNPGAADSWTAKEPTRYLFKIGHFSAGYDHIIAKKFTIGIEPFLKVPFEGIGWTDINLYSTGAYINLRYNILSVHND